MVRASHSQELTGSRVDTGVALHVIFSGLRRTQALLAAASEFARGLDARITILVPQVVPYPLPLEQPPVPIQFIEHSVAALGVNVDVYLCRDRCQAILNALPPESVVIMGASRWCFSENRRIAKILRRQGHRVVLAPS